MEIISLIKARDRWTVHILNRFRTDGSTRPGIPAESDPLCDTDFCEDLPLPIYSNKNEIVVRLCSIPIGPLNVQSKFYLDFSQTAPSIRDVASELGGRLAVAAFLIHRAKYHRPIFRTRSQFKNLARILSKLRKTILSA